MLRRRHRAGPFPPGSPGSAESAAQERQIVASLERLRDTTVREVMTPRVDVVALRAPVTADDVGRAVKESGHSRFPVYEEDLDDLLGVLFVKDLFRSDLFRSGGPVRLRAPFIVPEGRGVLEVLQEMRARRLAFAVVVDEHGGVEGVLTVKDLVSELVGELPDEFDKPEEAEITRVDPGRWLVDGACPVDRLREELGVDVPDGEYVTAGGFLFDRFGKIPSEGDAVHHQGWEFRVAEMDRRRIAKIVARAPSGTITPGAADEGATGK
ncbi:MAG TPA: hemolysin family protein [Acidimicrobiales bacterium]|nr:hemolysin family protein [Acidimicrobiales bacterium]